MDQLRRNAQQLAELKSAVELLERQNASMIQQAIAQAAPQTQTRRPRRPARAPEPTDGHTAGAVGSTMSYAGTSRAASVSVPDRRVFEYDGQLYRYRPNVVNPVF